MTKPRWGFDRLRTWKRRIVRADIGLPRRCEADAWEEETQAERSSREERSGGHAGFAATRARFLPRETVPSKARREGCKSWICTGTTTLSSCLRQATVSAAQGKRRLSHGFCPQWQKPQFAAHARHTVAMRIMRGSPPCTGEASEGVGFSPQAAKFPLKHHTATSSWACSP